MSYYPDETKTGVECNRLERRQQCLGIIFMHSDFGDWELCLCLYVWFWEIKIGRFWKTRK